MATAAVALLVGIAIGVVLTRWLTGGRSGEFTALDDMVRREVAKLSDTVRRFDRLMHISNPRGRYGEQILEDSACHNPNTPPPATPLVTGQTIQLPGHHAKVRRDGYIGHRRGGPAPVTANP